MAQFCREIWFYRRKLKFAAPNLLPTEDFFQIQVADAKRGDTPQFARGMLATTVSLLRSSSTGPKLHRSSRAKISCQPERLWRARRAISRDPLRRSNTDKDAPGLSLSLARPVRY